MNFLEAFEKLNKLTIPLLESKDDWNRLAVHLATYGKTGEQAIFVFKSQKDRLKDYERDIYFWLKKAPQEFIDRMAELEITKSKTQTDKVNRQSGYEKVAENDEWIVYKILTHEAAKQLGRGTKWCISARDPKWWDAYSAKSLGGLFYFFFRKTPKDDNCDKIALRYYPNKIDPEKLDRWLRNTWYEQEQSEIQFFDSLDKVFIPSYELNLPVKFDSCDFSDEIIQPYKTVRHDGRSSFWKEQGLKPETATDIIVEEGVETLEYGAFEKCTNLKNLKLPDSLTTIGSFVLSAHNEALTQLVIPDSVVTIKDNSFFYSKLKTVELSKNLVSLGASAFNCCESLEAINLPDSLINIGRAAFNNCPALKNIFIPKNVTKIDSFAFDHCPHLTICCETESKPEGWAEDWAGKPSSQLASIIWGAKR